MALNDNALTTLAACKEHLDIPTLTTTYDDKIEMLINVASNLIENYCNRTFRELTYTDQDYDGNNQSDLLLRHSPVSSVSSVYVDSSREFSATFLVDSDEYAIVEPCILRRHNGTWPLASRNVRITYDAGYSTMPDDVAYACILFVEFLYRSRTDRRLGRVSQSKGNESVHYHMNIPFEITAMIDPYIRFEFGTQRKSSWTT